MVADVSNEGLIGMDFLVQHEVSLDFAQQKIHLHGEGIQAQCQSAQARACRIAISEVVMIPAGSR